VEDQCCEAGMKKTLAVATLALLFFQLLLGFLQFPGFF